MLKKSTKKKAPDGNSISEESGGKPVIEELKLKKGKSPKERKSSRKLKKAESKVRKAEKALQKAEGHLSKAREKLAKAREKA